VVFRRRSSNDDAPSFRRWSRSAPEHESCLPGFDLTNLDILQGQRPGSSAGDGLSSDQGDF
jgi:hypothetical protein